MGFPGEAQLYAGAPSRKNRQPDNRILKDCRAGFAEFLVDESLWFMGEVIEYGIYATQLQMTIRSYCNRYPIRSGIYRP
jgi:hypothetical protein